MPAKRTVPEFKSETEEAEWWDNHQDEVFKDFERASTDGTLNSGTAVRLAGIPTTTIRLDPADIAMARTQAAKKGLKYQTYLKMILHEALVKEASRF